LPRIRPGETSVNKPFLRISLLDHGNTLKVRWVTDRLLHINVWSGRFGMSDGIIDVDRGTVVYDELPTLTKNIAVLMTSRRPARNRYSQLAWALVEEA
jgi:hypothetical protein